MIIRINKIDPLRMAEELDGMVFDANSKGVANMPQQCIDKPVPSKRRHCCILLEDE